MNHPFLQPVSPDAPHPFLKDADGGGIMGGGSEFVPKPTAQLWTAERIKSAKEREQACREWQLAPAGVAWIKAQSWFCMTWAVARFGDKAKVFV